MNKLNEALYNSVLFEEQKRRTPINSSLCIHYHTIVMMISKYEDYCRSLLFEFCEYTIFFFLSALPHYKVLKNLLL